MRLPSQEPGTESFHNTSPSMFSVGRSVRVVVYKYQTTLYHGSLTNWWLPPPLSQPISTTSQPVHRLLIHQINRQYSIPISNSSFRSSSNLCFSSFQKAARITKSPKELYYNGARTLERRYGRKGVAEDEQRSLLSSLSLASENHWLRRRNLHLPSSFP
jgi:hypothetical protein